MKYIIQATEFIIIVILLALSVTTFNKINRVELIETIDHAIEESHLAIITDDVQSYAYNKFILGVNTTAKTFGSSYEIYEVGEQTLDDIFNMIIITEVDGVILRLSDNTVANESINRCKEAGIHLVAIGNDAPESTRDVYIGTNKFDLGRHAANLAIDAIGFSGNVGIILGSEYLDQNAIATNNFINGIQEIISKTKGVELKVIEYSYDTRAELIMDELLDLNEKIDVLICTDPLDVNRIIRVLVDRNRVGEVKIIASGDTDEIIDSIHKKLITASIVEDFTNLGSLSVSYLNQVIRDEGVSTYVNIPFETIHQTNLGLE